MVVSLSLGNICTCKEVSNKLLSYHDCTTAPKINCPVKASCASAVAGEEAAKLCFGYQDRDENLQWNAVYYGLFDPSHGSKYGLRIAKDTNG